MLSFMRMALQGHLDPAWLLAWGLLLLTVIPLRLWSTWAQGQVARGGGGVLKARLLAGGARPRPLPPSGQGGGGGLLGGWGVGGGWGCFVVSCVCCSLQPRRPA